MNYCIDSDWLPKEGHSLQEFEDAFYPRKRGEFNEKQLMLAIADGASESILSGKWAQLLVKLSCRRSRYFADHELLLARACRGWRLWLRAYLREREKSAKPIQWYEEPGLEAGAFASLVCLRLLDEGRDGEGSWEALAFGDSCLFQVREQKLIASFPLNASAQFNNRPYLLSSNPKKNRDAGNQVKRADGRWQKNDVFFLMTDAMAAWFLKQIEQGESPWMAILGKQTEQNKELLPELVEYLRKRNSIRNDDVSVIRLDIR